MRIRTLQTVVLATELPAYGLRPGDLGTVVEACPGDRLEVEFVTASGRTKAVVTLDKDHVRPVGPNDILAVRHSDAA